MSERDALSSEVVAALAAVETAAAPVDPAGYQALRDPALRAEVERALEACGRRLVERDGRFVSGFADETADWLAGGEHDQLTVAADRAYPLVPAEQARVSVEQRAKCTRRWVR